MRYSPELEERLGTTVAVTTRNHLLPVKVTAVNEQD